MTVRIRVAKKTSFIELSSNRLGDVTDNHAIPVQVWVALQSSKQKVIQTNIYQTKHSAKHNKNISA